MCQGHVIWHGWSAYLISSSFSLSFRLWGCLGFHWGIRHEGHPLSPPALLLFYLPGCRRCAASWCAVWGRAVQPHALFRFPGGPASGPFISHQRGSCLPEVPKSPCLGAFPSCSPVCMLNKMASKTLVWFWVYDEGQGQGLGLAKYQQCCVHKKSVVLG